MMPIQGKCLFNIDVFINEAYTACIVPRKDAPSPQNRQQCVSLQQKDKKVFGLKINIATLGCIVYESHFILKDSSNQD